MFTALVNLFQVVFCFYLTTAKAQLILSHKGEIVHSFLTKTIIIITHYIA